MKALTIVLTVILLAGCAERHSGLDHEYLISRLQAADLDRDRLEETLHEHLCEFHKDDYDCESLQDIYDDVAGHTLSGDAASTEDSFYVRNNLWLRPLEDSADIAEAFSDSPGTWSQAATTATEQPEYPNIETLWLSDMRKYGALYWLVTRTHFDDGGITIVGHDMLVTSVDAVDALAGELLTCQQLKADQNSD